MRESLGLVETVGISTAIEVADVMVKAANVKILELENSKGGGYMTVKVVGDVGAVKAAVNAAKAAGIKYGNLVSASVIARPSDGMSTLFCNPKVPYQSVNKKPIPQAWEEDEPEKLNYAVKKAAPKAVEEPKVKETKAKKAKVEEAKVEEPKVEEAKAEEPKAEDPKVEEAKVEEPKAEEPKIEEAKAEEPKAEEPKVEEVKAEATPKQEEPKATKTPKETEGKSQAKPRRSSRRKK